MFFFSSPKKIKIPRLIKILRELKNVEDAIEEISRIEELILKQK